MKGLSRLRAQIEKLDRKIVRLLNERLELSAEIGDVKRRTRDSPFAPEREEYLLRFLEAENPGPLLPAHLRSIYHEIFSSSRSRQAPLVIGYLGAPVSAALMAARARFGSAETYRPHPTWKALLSALRSGKAQVGVIPASALAQTSGSASPLGKTLRICGEIPLAAPIGKETHYLIAPAAGPSETGEEETGAKSTGANRIWIFQAPRSFDAGGFSRWCRRHRLQPIRSNGSTHWIETDRSGKTPATAPLEASLQSAFGPQARLRLLGAFASPPYGR